MLLVSKVTQHVQSITKEVYDMCKGIKKTISNFINLSGFCSVFFQMIHTHSSDELTSKLSPF